MLVEYFNYFRHMSEKEKKILIAGGTGFVGNALIQHLTSLGYSIHVFAQKKYPNSKNVRYFQWNTAEGYIDEKAFEGVSIVINLTGANIGEKRWSSSRKRQIIESRVKSLELLYEYALRATKPIELLISSSAVGYYGAVTTDQVFTEESPNGSDFLADVCKKWEEAALRFENLDTQVILLRKGVVLGKEGGMYTKLKPLAQMGINIALGTGKQYLPWIDIRDVVYVYQFILENRMQTGIYNVCTSQHQTMNDFSNAFLHAFGKKKWLPNALGYVVKLLFGEMSKMLLEGSRVSNKKLLETGFEFRFGTLKKSLES